MRDIYIEQRNRQAAQAARAERQNSICFVILAMLTTAGYILASAL